MMKTSIIFASLATLSTTSLFAHSEAETNQLIETVVLQLRYSEPGGCQPRPKGDPVPEDDDQFEYLTMEALFNPPAPGDGCQEPYGNWSAEERKLAFDSYLSDLTSATNMTEKEMIQAHYALLCSMERGYTNAIDAVYSIIRSPTSPLKSAAWDAVLNVAEPSEEMNDFASVAVTNDVMLSGLNKTTFYHEYSRMLALAYDKGKVSIARDGAKILYLAAEKGTANRFLDQLLVKCYPSYAISSNRLAYTELAIGDATNDWWTSYFTTLTNQLHQAAQPLPVVPELSPTP